MTIPLEPDVVVDIEHVALGDDPTDIIEAPVVPAVVIPDRADAPVSEITERFLKMVVAHVPLDRIEELHLFSPLRQGGVETGIAVIAARVPVVLPLIADPELLLETAEEAVLADVPVSALETVAEADVVTLLEPSIETLPDSLLLEHSDAFDEPPAVETTDDDIEAALPVLRHTVYTARYRLVQKGPERGKWEASVVAEAEAPLLTVDLVVRGVQRRAGEESEILRYTAAQIARALHLPAVAAIL